MITAMNLTNDVVYEFDDATAPLWAVCYAYCADNDQLDDLFVSAHNNTFLDFAKTLPVTVGQCSIACGDWASTTSTTSTQPRPHTASAPLSSLELGEDKHLKSLLIRRLLPSASPQHQPQQPQQPVPSAPKENENENRD